MLAQALLILDAVNKEFSMIALLTALSSFECVLLLLELVASANSVMPLVLLASS